jgi:hypothetical protein
VPLIDSVAAGTRWALRGNAVASERTAPGFDVPWENMPPEMRALSLRS